MTLNNHQHKTVHSDHTPSYEQGFVQHGTYFYTFVSF